MPTQERTRTRTMGPPSEPERPRSSLLYVVMHGSSVLRAPSRHRLDDVDSVEIGRSSRPRIVRDDRRLILGVDDPWMSVEHARVHRRPSGWSLEDAGSKNGTHVLGSPRADPAPDEPTSFRAGQTFFLLRPAWPDDGESPPDLGADELSGPPGLRTMEPTLQRSFARLRRIAASQTPVVIGGETGTGKELLARAVHELSDRRGKFVALNCASLSESLIASELFGHRKGAFSGATTSGQGWVVAAEGGTLLLDEVAELPLSAQAALLRVLQEREVVPVGGTGPRKVDVRFLCATHRDLEAEVEAGRFREDLLARLGGFAVELPPLRERPGDLGLFVRTFATQLTTDTIEVTAAAGEALLRYRWPRNIRELEQTLRVAHALAPRGVIDIEHLPAAVRDAPTVAADEQDPLPTRLEQLLREHQGNVSEVARAMGKHRQQIQKWIRRFGIDVDAIRRDE